MKDLKASILGIGTELTQGQIINQNAQWISQQLELLGVDCSSHLVVPDQETLMLDGLRWCDQHSDLIFVTGGLGPTSDDFTRDIIAKFLNLPLQWHEPSWRHIQAYFERSGRTAKDIQKQQAYFPQGSEILNNTKGTANGFRLSYGVNKHIVVLPGPPREIHQIWSSQLENWLQQITTDLDPWITDSWHCLGVGESDVALELMPVIPKEYLSQIGYRVHLPYVEVKLMYKKSQSSVFATLSQEIQTKLAAWTVLKNKETAIDLLCKKLENFKSIQICCPGFTELISKKLSATRSAIWQHNISFSNSSELQVIKAQQIQLMITQQDSDYYVHTVSEKHQHKTKIIAPDFFKKAPERLPLYVLEMSILTWAQQL